MKPYPWQTKQWQQLLAATRQQRLPHALLLVGEAGMGLVQFAYSFAAWLLCEESDNVDSACGICKPCLLLQAGNHPDLLAIEPEDTGKQIRVDAIRHLVEYVYMKSQYARYKLAIITPAEAMNRSAANGLLKTLEEPPAKALMMLLTERSSLLPVTIRSRCQKLHFQPGYDEARLQWLRARIKDEQVNVEDLLVLAQGAPLSALEILQSDAVQQQISLLEDLEALRQRKIDPVKTAEKWLTQDAALVFKQLLDFFLSMSRLKLGASANNSTVHKHLQRIIKGLDLVQLIHCHQLLLRHYHQVTGPISLNKQGLLEDFIIYWQATAERRGG